MMIPYKSLKIAIWDLCAVRCGLKVVRCIVPRPPRPRGCIYMVARVARVLSNRQATMVASMTVLH